MKHLILLALFVAFAAAPKTLHAETSSDNLIKVSGLHKMHSQLSEQLFNAFRISLAPIEDKPSPEQFNTLNTLFMQAFTAKKIDSAVDSALSEKLTEQEMETLTAWYTSKAGAKIVEKEALMYDQVTTDQVTKNKDSILENKDNLDRAKEVFNLNFDNKDLALDIAKKGATLSTLVYVAWKNPAATIDTKAVEEHTSKMVEKNKEEMEQQVLALLAHTYEDVSSKDFKKYVAFLKTPTYKKFINTYVDSFLSSIDTEIEELVMQVRSDASLNGKSPNQILAEQAQQYLPLEVDSTMILQSIEAVGKDALTYNYTITDGAEDYKTENRKDMLTGQIKDSLCFSQEGDIIRSNSIVVDYIYRDEDGKDLLVIQFDTKTCQ
jgi:hypothetical protein